MQFFSVTTQLYCLTDQLHVLPTVSSDDQAIPKNIKNKEILQLLYCSVISDLTNVLRKVFTTYMICVLGKIK
jgi:hypothetical protein